MIVLFMILLFLLFFCFAFVFHAFVLCYEHKKDTRLNNRWLDLRVPANNAIMRIRSGISLLFRQALDKEGFIEINTPKLISGESEGGSEVFRTDYFGKV